VISTSVCVSVCLSVCLSVSEDISGTTRAIFTSFFSAHVAYGRGSVLLRQSDEVLRGRGNLWGSPGHSKPLAIIAVAVAASFAAKWIIQSPITSVCQATEYRNPENSERRLEGGDESAQSGRSLISTIALFIIAACRAERMILFT